MGWNLKASTRGPRGFVGAIGPDGLPGVNAVSNDAAIAVLVKTAAASATRDALDIATSTMIIDSGAAIRRPMDTPPRTFFGKAAGLSSATIAAGGTGYAVGNEITLAGGVNQAAAVVTVSSVSAGVITAVTVTIPGIYTTNPTNPAAQSSTTGTGTGATFTGSWAGKPIDLRNRATLAPNSASYRFTGNGPVDKGGGFWGNAGGNGTASLWEWECDAPKLDIQLGGSNTRGQLYVDGQRINLTDLITLADGAQYVYTLDFGGASRMRSYRLFTTNSSFAGVSTTTTDVLRYPSITKKFAWGLGDSYMFGNGATNLSLAAFNVMCEQLGWEGLPDGVGGSGWTGGTAGLPAARVNAKMVGITRTVEYVILDMGLNNAGGVMADVQTGFNDAVAAVQAASATAKIIVFGPATPVGETANLILVKNAIKDRCTALGLTFIDVANWVNTDNMGRYTDADATHPTPAGHVYLGTRKALAVRRALNI